jgi:hypothetical protein
MRKWLKMIDKQMINRKKIILNDEEMFQNYREKFDQLGKKRETNSDDVYD